jgi:hypothetical protein
MTDKSSGHRRAGATLKWRSQVPAAAPRKPRRAAAISALAAAADMMKSTAMSEV